MKLTTPLALTLALTFAPAAFAQEIEVRYADLDLNRVEGQHELERRIDIATRRVCRAEPIAGSRIINRREQRRCEAQAHTQAESQMPR